MTVSDGAVRRFVPEVAILVEDTTGQGHIRRIVGDQETHAAIVQLPD
ncbi:MAG TPA: hypothetical protein VFL91_05210 [Thermomicrobiales bacterium]|nr:hypothetical protein [Thermomicrobiales bacterium]